MWKINSEHELKMLGQRPRNPDRRRNYTDVCVLCVCVCCYAWIWGSPCGTLLWRVSSPPCCSPLVVTTTNTGRVAPEHLTRCCGMISGLCPQGMQLGCFVPLQRTATPSDFSSARAMATVLCQGGLPIASGCLGLLPFDYGHPFPPLFLFLSLFLFRFFFDPSSFLSLLSSLLLSFANLALTPYQPWHNNQSDNNVNNKIN